MVLEFHLSPESFAAAMSAVLKALPGQQLPEEILTSVEKLPSSRFRGTMPLFLKICEVDVENSLPPLYRS